MFNIYTNGKREIKATEKAYELIYKSQGFIEEGEEMKARVKIKRDIDDVEEIQEVEKTEPLKDDLSTTKETIDTNAYDDMTKLEIGELLTEKGIEFTTKETKAELLELLLGSD